MSDPPTTRITDMPYGPCPACQGNGTRGRMEGSRMVVADCSFCNGRGSVPEIVLSDEDYEQVAMHLTGTETIEEAVEALKRGPL